MDGYNKNYKAMTFNRTIVELKSLSCDKMQGAVHLLTEP